jgi:hypothetical protein
MANKLSLVLLFVLFGLVGYAQKVEDIYFEAEDDIVKIYYTLKGDFSEQTFEVKIYTSVDNYQKPLEKIKGDVNRKNINPGKKMAEWSAKEEYKIFEGEIAFKIVANVISNYWISAPSKGDILKRGKKYEISWEGFRPGASVRITAHFPNGRIDEIATYVTGKSYQWKVKGPAGKGAHIRVTEMENKSAFAKSSNFTIKRKVPMVAQLGTVAAATGAVLFFVLKPVPTEPLPYPPNPSK